MVVSTLNEAKETLEVLPAFAKVRDGCLAHNVLLEINSQFEGFYVCSLLCQSVNSEVYVAKDVDHFDRLVVLKICFDDELAEHEVGILSKLEHEGLPVLIKRKKYVLGESCVTVLVFPFLGPYSLLDYFDSDDSRKGTFHCLHVLNEVAKTLVYVHSKGIVHCDVKPSNIVLDDFGRVRLVDFDAARTCETKRSFRGTKDFIPNYLTEHGANYVEYSVSTFLDCHALFKTSAEALRACGEFLDGINDVINHVRPHRNHYPELWSLLSACQHNQSMGKKRNRVTSAFGFSLLVVCTAFLIWSSTYFILNVRTEPNSIQPGIPPTAMLQGQLDKASDEIAVRVESDSVVRPINLEALAGPAYLSEIDRLYASKEWLRVRSACEKLLIEDEVGLDWGQARLWLGAEVAIALEGESQAVVNPADLIQNKFPTKITPSLKFDIQLLRIIVSPESEPLFKERLQALVEKSVGLDSRWRVKRLREVQMAQLIK